MGGGGRLEAGRELASPRRRDKTAGGWKKARAIKQGLTIYIYIIIIIIIIECRQSIVFKGFFNTCRLHAALALYKKSMKPKKVFNKNYQMRIITIRKVVKCLILKGL